MPAVRYPQVFAMVPATALQRLGDADSCSACLPGRGSGEPLCESPCSQEPLCQPLIPEHPLSVSGTCLASTSSTAASLAQRRGPAGYERLRHASWQLALSFSSPLSAVTGHALLRQTRSTLPAKPLLGPRVPKKMMDSRVVRTKIADSLSIACKWAALLKPGVSTAKRDRQR